MTSSFLTETDMLKALVRKGAFSDVSRELNSQINNGDGAKDEASI